MGLELGKGTTSVVPQLAPGEPALAAGVSFSPAASSCGKQTLPGLFLTPVSESGDSGLVLKLFLLWNRAEQPFPALQCAAGAPAAAT
jgi:hypothetical protein